VSIQATCRAAIAELQGDIGDECTWNSQTLPCVASQLRAGAFIVVGGGEVSIGLTLYIDQSEITSGTPSAGQVITYKSTQYRIASATRSGSDSHWKLDLTSDAL
jgi:hypothetical protein